MFNRVLLLVSFVLLVGSLKALLDYWQYDEVTSDVATLMLHQVSNEQVKAHVQQAIADDKPDEARMYLSIAKTFGYALDPAQFEADLQRLESPLNTALRNGKDFASGFVGGSSDSGAGVAGAITSDFTVIGDARDLWEQYQLYAKGEPVNELVVTLAGIGVGLTAATVASAGSAGAAKGGVSTFKLASRTKRLTPAFQKYLLRIGSKVFDYKAFMEAARAEKSLEGVSRAATKAYNPAAIKMLEETSSQANNIRKASSTSDAIHLLSYVDNAEDLGRLEKLSLKYGTETKGILKLLGKGAISTMRVLRKSAEFIISIIATLVSGLASLFSLGGMVMRRVA